MKEEKIIISLGGSIIVPNEIDIDFLKKFKDLIISFVEQGKKFIIITGGGKTCRVYQDASRKLCNPTSEDLDWIGIKSLKLNAELVRVIFGELAHKKVIENLALPFDFNTPILIGSACEPGHSTDYDAVLAAINAGVKKIINLSNIDYVYDSDPRVNKEAKMFEKISWAEYRDVIPKEWNPGLSSPFDPVASAICEKEGIEVAIMNGKNLDNLKNYLDGEDFKGTVIF